MRRFHPCAAGTSSPQPSRSKEPPVTPSISAGRHHAPTQLVLVRHGESVGTSPTSTHASVALGAST